MLGASLKEGMELGALLGEELGVELGLLEGKKLGLIEMEGPTEGAGVSIVGL